MRKDVPELFDKKSKETSFDVSMEKLELEISLELNDIKKWINDYVITTENPYKNPLSIIARDIFQISIDKKTQSI